MCLPTGSQGFKNSFLMLRIYSRAQFESCVLVFAQEQKPIKMDMKNPRSDDGNKLLENLLFNQVPLPAGAGFKAKLLVRQKTNVLATSLRSSIKLQKKQEQVISRLTQGACSRVQILSYSFHFQTLKSRLTLPIESQ